MQLRKAERQHAKLRIGVSGFAGSGKTLSSLMIAYGICGDWSKICLIDTEYGRADYYAHLGPFNIIQINNTFETEKYLAALAEAEINNEVIIIDTLSPAWNGPGGIIDLHSNLQINKNMDNFRAWAIATPIERKLRYAIMSCKAHTIVNIRSDSKLTKIEGKVAKINIKLEYRKGIEYDFAIMGEMCNSVMTITKDNTGIFAEDKKFIPAAETGQKIAEWCAMVKVPVTKGDNEKPPINSPTPPVTQLVEGDSLKYYKAAEKLYIAFGREDFWQRNKAKIALMPLERIHACYLNAVKEAKEKLDVMSPDDCLNFCDKLPAEIQKLKWIEAIVVNKIQTQVKNGK